MIKVSGILDTIKHSTEKIKKSIRQLKCPKTYEDADIHDTIPSVDYSSTKPVDFSGIFGN